MCKGHIVPDSQTQCSLVHAFVYTAFLAFLPVNVHYLKLELLERLFSEDADTS